MADNLHGRKIASLFCGRLRWIERNTCWSREFTGNLVL